MLTTIADFISVVFSPALMLSILFLTVLSHSLLPETDKSTVLKFFFGLAFLPILTTFLALRLSGKISDWEINQRRQRLPFYGFCLVYAVVFFLTLMRFSFYQIANFILIMIIWLGLKTVISLFWKISGHSSAMTLFSLYMLNIFGIGSWWWLLIIPAVAWSRVYRKNHTFAQVTAGIFLSLVVFSLSRFLRLI